MFQEPETRVLPIAVVATITFILLGVLLASQFPVVLESEAWSLVASLLVTGSVTTATLLLAGRHALLPLFALLIAVHTMLPVSRLVAIILAVIITAAHITLSVVDRVSSDFKSYYIQVKQRKLLKKLLNWISRIFYFKKF